LQLCTDVFDLIGSPSQSWISTYLSEEPIPEFTPLYNEKKSNLVSKEKRSKNILKRFQETYGEEKIQLVASILGGPTIFLQILNLITDCLQYDPSSRPTINDCLSHPCFTYYRQVEKKQGQIQTWKPFQQEEKKEEEEQSKKQKNFRTTPSLKRIEELSSSVQQTPTQIRFKYLRKFTFEKICVQLQKNTKTKLLEKDEVAAIMACSISLFDRDWKAILGPMLKIKNGSFTKNTIRKIVSFAITSTWLSAKYLSFLLKKPCLAILADFNHLCSLSDILSMETHILNQEHFTFPRSFLQTEFSISADLYQILSLNLDHSEDIAEEMFSTLLRENI